MKIVGASKKGHVEAGCQCQVYESIQYKAADTPFSSFVSPSFSYPRQLTPDKRIGHQKVEMITFEFERKMVKERRMTVT